MLITFGKYKNQSIENIFQKDKQYIKWLCNQKWYEENHEELYKMSKNIMNNHKPLINKDKFIVYTDGACPSNGMPGARSSIGVHFSEKNPIELDDISEKLFLKEHSNNIAELMAIFKCLEVIKENNITIPIYLYTDSRYCQFILTEWYEHWIKNNTLKNKKNIPLIEKTHKIYKSFNNLTILYVKGHSRKTDEHSYGNYVADLLAKNALKNI